MASNEVNETNVQNQTSPARSTGSSLAIPIAIVVGFGLIAASIYFGSSKNVTTPLAAEEEQQSGDLEALAPITADDHIRGNPNAPLVIVEYSDFDCPFCRNFHITMQKIMDDYGPTGQVAWVYRHFPLSSLHPSAAYIAEASECVAELGGNEAFWTFSDLVFIERGINELTNVTRLPEFAVTAGVEEAAFKECLDSGRLGAKVQEDFDNAVAIGGRGTPHSLIVIGDQKMEITGGAQPYEVVKQMIDNLLR
ncbi:MAG: thioredoxin domain-containing protein [Candidatus Paceibacterota bacterium]